MDRMVSIVARFMAKQCAGESELEQHKVQVHTLVRRWTCYDSNDGDDLVDGGGDQRQEAAGDEEDDPETQGGRAGHARAEKI